MTTVPRKKKKKISRILSWKEASSSPLTMIYRAILCDITEDHTVDSLQVYLNSKLQIVLGIIFNKK